MSNGNEPAYPRTGSIDIQGYGVPDQVGLTPREHACILLRIPESGDAELDALIAKAQRRDVAALALQGAVAKYASTWSKLDLAQSSVVYADALLAELEKTR